VAKRKKCGSKHAKKTEKVYPQNLEFTASERKPPKRTWLLPSKLKHLNTSATSLKSSS